MEKVLIICRSITHAQTMQHILEKEGYWCGIYRAPTELRLKKCAYAVTIYEKDYILIKSILKAYRVQCVSAYLYKNKRYKLLEEFI